MNLVQILEALTQECEVLTGKKVDMELSMPSDVVDKIILAFRPVPRDGDPKFDRGPGTSPVTFHLSGGTVRIKESS